MTKKMMMIMTLASALLLSACGSNSSPEPTVTPTIEATQVPTRISDFEGSMPCSTVYDYEVSPDIAQYQSAVDQQPPITDEDWIYGESDAPITIVEYADFQCPACVGFSLGVKDLIADFPSSIRIVFRHLPLPSIHDKAYISGMAAEAAGAQGKFWEMHDLLYSTQQEWNGFTVEEFSDWVTAEAEEKLALDLDQFTEDLNDADKQAELEEINAERLALGMTYTPFVVINDRVYRNNKPDLASLIGIYEYGGSEECPPWVIDPEKSYMARLDTSAGMIEIRLYPEEAPLAVNSFIFLAQSGWYDEVYFHRVIEGFVAQAGDPSGLGISGPGYTFANETSNGLSFDRAGILGMANAGVDTNGSQFFITLAPAATLDGGYTIFGELTEDSLDVLEKIALRDPQTAIGFEEATVINGIEIITD